MATESQKCEVTLLFESSVFFSGFLGVSRAKTAINKKKSVIRVTYALATNKSANEQLSPNFSVSFSLSANAMRNPDPFVCRVKSVCMYAYLCACVHMCVYVWHLGHASSLALSLFTEKRII